MKASPDTQTNPAIYSAPDTIPPAETLMITSGDFTLEACSPCLPGNHPDGDACGPIGALDEGCPCGP